MTNEKKRLQWIDCIKGICMIAVIMSHLNWQLWYARFLSPIFLTGFFFVSGYTFNAKDSFRTFVAGKVRGLLLPILFWGTLNAFLAHFIEGKSLWDRMLGLVIQVPGDWDDLWFVACLLAMELIYYALISLFGSLRYLTCAVSLLFSIGFAYMKFMDFPLPWHMVNVCLLMPFFHFGYLARKTEVGGKVIIHLKQRSTITILSVLYVLCVLVKNNTIDIHLLHYNSFMLFFIAAILGLGALVGIAMNLEDCSKSNVVKGLQFVGQNTLIYYALQSKPIRLILGLKAYLGMHGTFYLETIIYSIIVSLILAIPTVIVNKYFPFLVGKKYIR